MNFSGYDLIGVTVYHGNMQPEEFREFVRGEYAAVADSARLSGAHWLVSEVWFPYKGPFYPFEYSRDGQSLDDLQDDYFRISIEEFQEFSENVPAGYIFMAWTMPGMDVKGRPAEEALQEFFGAK